MTNPVPGYYVTTKYGIKGSNWTTCGTHTGQDYAAPEGTSIVAARGGLVAYVSYGSSFGSHQFAVRPGDGTEDFYAHTRSRPPSGIRVELGEPIAQVGNEGNSTGPHLHLERHTSYGWGCSLMADPMLSHNAGGEPAPEPDPPRRETDMILIASPDGRVHLMSLQGPAYIHSAAAMEEIRAALVDPSHVAAVDGATFERFVASSPAGSLP